ncbi:rhamnosyl/mannosyltransferase [Desulfobotulus alkaliphilus]|uniref:Rhamnosyl/mannosyltransferase n=1 Tax=Desulfobotulus alkaliphilus TaxID=622671 RepID=A0A562RAH4_9BACT|nr:glycosyltransferase [Desulfobotulus alkaliphilus]TWI66067.1 rhamnosyl/mannosyltransferase [Desulfobotulus alkaliphilus]
MNGKKIKKKGTPFFNVLLVTKFYPPSIGGIETAVQQYARWYQAMGFRVQVLCCANERCMRTSMEEIEGIRIIRCASLGNILSTPASLHFFLHFFRLAHRADIVHINLQFPWASMAASLPLSRIRGRLIVTYHSDVFRQRKLKHITYIFDRNVIRKADTVITGSLALQKSSEVLSSIPRSMDVLPFAMDLDFVEREKRAYACSENHRKIFLPENFIRDGYYVFFGRLVAYKGTRVMEEAFRMLAEQGTPINLIVFGNGPERYRFIRLAKEFGKNILFFDSTLPHGSKYHLLAHARALLFPSEFPSEAFGIAQLDAMAVEKAIINTKLGTGVNWVAPDRLCAITLEAGNPSMLASTLLECEAGKHDLEKLGKAGKKRVQELFSEQSVGQQFARIVRRR